ncbi:WxcM-like domain-containing protein [Vibrio fluvialis]|uniref:WxcM-like domain-containing protein n=1 Tax=Vibrio fluvialis TaxID=676 RepID=UPI00192CC1F0|nr:WxcM-like domain-containing protein [Vibrio fluvialis]ELI5735297.1 WxcM-like domain-containing protein [Vibrio fluvialis]MBL4244521.1 WxcM-like domain-containing protein [Vibrio fluvialis]MBL4253489.1 WxcM-like domain-containing protein [Vibrio fluvialis]MBY7933676.1 WxcM-like domain-containing protein [Vibrio fluvialis]MBY8186402.1 WxcM-like domain-containing protein [Vibrio fluvialis]
MYIHDTAICESEKIGNKTNIWAFAHILPGATIGENCNVCDGVFIENDVVVGDNVTIKCGVQLWDGIVVEDDVFIGPNVTFTNDIMPRSKQYPEKFLITTVRKGASIGANATILPGIEIGQGAMVGAGAVVTQSVPPYATVVGNPARIINYNTKSTFLSEGIDSNKLSQIVSKSFFSKCSIISLPQFSDLRGSLVAIEHRENIPFLPQRSFLVYGVNSNKVRGEHAHKECEQFLVAVSGELSVVLDNGEQRQEVRLNSPSNALYIPPGIWGVQYQFSKDAVLLVYASHAYDDSDYIRDYDEFLKFVNSNN